MVNLSKADAGGLIGAHKHIQSGKIGKILHVEARFHQGWLAGPKSATTPMRISGAWRLSSKKGLGALGDLGTHLFSVADTLCGSINEISCRVRTFDKLGGVHAKADANDSFVASVSFADGALGAIRATRWASGCGWGDIFITAFGEHGSVEVNLAEMFHGFKHFSCKTNAWKTEKLKPAPSTFVRFIRSVRSGKNDPLSFEYGRKIQAYLHHCLMSDRQNRPVKVPS
jgi:predicted dehydrogenase